jgi:hypothetical protein
MISILSWLPCCFLAFKRVGDSSRDPPGGLWLNIVCGRETAEFSLVYAYGRTGRVPPRGLGYAFWL